MVLAGKWLARWMESKQLTVDKNRCTHVKNQQSSCHSCVESCPVSAIQLNNGLAIDFDKCIECMNCTTACPTDVFGDKNYKSYLEQMNGRQVISLTCHKQAENTKGISIPCIRLVDESLLLYALKENKPVQIHFNEQVCQTCEYRLEQIPIDITRLINKVKRLKNANVQVYLNKSETIKSEQLFSRRDLFSFFTKKIQSNLITPFIAEEEVSNKQREKIIMSPKRRFYIQQIKQSYESTEPLLIDDLKATIVKISEKCSGCLRCTYVCPTGSLYVDNQNDNFSIMQHLQSCVNCKSCQDICQENALIFDSESLTVQQFLQDNDRCANSLHEKNCSSCGELLENSHLTICNECQNKVKQEEAAFSIW